MRTEPRRRDRTMKTSQEMELLLERMPVGRLAVTTEDGPYIVALNYVFLEGNVYFHCGKEGRKMEALRADPRVCFLVDDVGPRVITAQGCRISQIYESVVCFGKAEVVEGMIEKKQILEKLMQKFVPADYPLSPITDEKVEKTEIVKIVIESMSGKANPISSSHTILHNRFELRK